MPTQANSLAAVCLYMLSSLKLKKKKARACFFALAPAVIFVTDKQHVFAFFALAPAVIFVIDKPHMYALFTLSLL